MVASLMKRRLFRASAKQLNRSDFTMALRPRQRKNHRSSKGLGQCLGLIMGQIFRCSMVFHPFLHKPIHAKCIMHLGVQTKPFLDMS